MNVQTIDYQAADARQNLAQSLHETGFAVLANHPIDGGRIDDIYDAWADFFADANKQDWLHHPENHDGYFPFKSENAKDAAEKDLKEFYHVYSWGRVPPKVEQLTRAMHHDLVQLGVELLGWLQAMMPPKIQANMTAPLTEMMADSEQSLLRILHYPPIAAGENAGAVRAAAHEDINLITLLLAGSKPGLEAQDKSGKWHKISGDAGMIAINNGDMLSLATGGYYPSTTHRVTNPDNMGADTNEGGNVSRYSMPMFLHPRSDAALVPQMTADMFLQQRLKAIGLK